MGHTRVYLLALAFALVLHCGPASAQTNGDTTIMLIIETAAMKQKVEFSADEMAAQATLSPAPPPFPLTTAPGAGNCGFHHFLGGSSHSLY